MKWEKYDKYNIKDRKERGEKFTNIYTDGCKKPERHWISCGLSSLVLKTSAGLQAQINKMKRKRKVKETKENKKVKTKN